MATTHASGRVLAIRRPRSPARPAASGSSNNASERADSMARQPAVSRAVSVVWWISSSPTRSAIRPPGRFYTHLGWSNVWITRNGASGKVRGRSVFLITRPGCRPTPTDNALGPTLTIPRR